MKRLPQTPDLLALAERTVWYKRPEEAVADQLNLVAHVLTYGDHEDVKVLRRYLDLDDIRASLDRAPPGVFDARSWSYWNAMVGRFPPPPMPRRVFPD
ncbi:MAG TPA: hypothetical protein VKP67_13880 [Xanthobacteraceae bacterium]|nr:hypothetical protein [Xanthobacteraceae bacterium]